MTTQVKERGMLFAGEAVRAILDGRKTQIRRPVKGDPCWDTAPAEYTNCPGTWTTNEAGDDRKSPYGVPGERVWVRETFLYRNNGKSVVYAADLDPIDAAGFGAMYGDLPLFTH